MEEMSSVSEEGEQGYQPCLICLSPAPPASLWNILLNSNTFSAFVRNDEEQDCLNIHICAVFVLRNLLKVERRRLESFLVGEVRTGPGDWFSVCGSCSRVVEKGLVLHLQLLEVTRKLEEVRTTLRTSLLGSRREKSGVKRRRQSGFEGGLKRVGEVIRDWVVQDSSNKENLTNGACVKVEYLEDEFITNIKSEVKDDCRWDTSSPEGRGGSLVDVKEEIDCDSRRTVSTNPYRKVDDGSNSSDSSPSDDDGEDPSFTPSKMMKTRRKEDGKAESKGLRKCDRCDFGARSWDKIARHKITHVVTDNFEYLHYKKLFRCKLCSVLEEQKQRIYVHLREVHSITARPKDTGSCFKCTICSATFTLRRNLLAHFQNIHQKRRRHICQTCGKGFIAREKYDDHVAKHADKQSRHRVCKECGAEFGSISGLRLHISTCHKRPNSDGNEEDTPKKGMGFNCKYCGSLFLNKALRTQHLRTVHADKYRYKCDLCDFAYVSSAGLYQHVQDKHVTGGKIPCPNCISTFATKATLRVHMAKNCAKNASTNSTQALQTVIKMEVESNQPD